MPARKKKKVALVFTGAVSLGSFEAGVAYEIVRYLYETDNPEFEVDVIVGTSAGALTGALTALLLVFGMDPRILEEAWMSVRLEDLAKLNPGDRSLLSSSKVEQLIARYIRPPSPEFIRARPQNETMRFVAVVTNLDGVKYRIHRGKEDEFSISAIGYEDAFKFRIERDFSAWERLRTAVRASSAYPAAFEHKTVLRGDHEFRRLARYNFPAKGEKPFRYADGGIVNNQPLNRAIEVVNELPADIQNGGLSEEGERIFLVVDPSPPENEAGHRQDFGVFDVVGKAVWTIPRNQTLYKDLLLLEKINRRIRWKNSFVSALAEIWNASPISIAQAQTFDDLCNEVALFKGKTILGMDPGSYLETEKERIRNAYRTEIARVAHPDLFVKYCFLLEQVADLRNKQEISVEMIKPIEAEKELAGVIYGNFGGFLDTGFMRHDFNVGRTYARRWLKKETEISRPVPCREKSVPAKVQRKILRRLLDNSIPLLVEEIGPRIFSGRSDSPPEKGLGVLNLMGMFVISVVRYLGRKSFHRTRDRISP